MFDVPSTQSTPQPAAISAVLPFWDPNSIYVTTDGQTLSGWTHIPLKVITDHFGKRHDNAMSSIYGSKDGKTAGMAANPCFGYPPIMELCIPASHGKREQIIHTALLSSRQSVAVAGWMDLSIQMVLADTWMALVTSAHSGQVSPFTALGELNNAMEHMRNQLAESERNRLMAQEQLTKYQHYDQDL